MCGIAGILRVCSGSDRLKTQIQQMQAALQHRGPDDRGIYLSPDRTAALTHTRLAVLDLSPAGHQPMSTPDGRYWISFNGEIYNFRALRSQLAQQGEAFRTQTDTEVILKLYQRSGMAGLDALRGMFAFAIWDAQEQTCLLMRDPLGIKPLYYWQAGHTLVFASELRAVLASGLPAARLCPTGLYGYLVGGSVPEPATLIEGVCCLPAGGWLRWQAGRSAQTSYWQPRFSPVEMSKAEALAKVRSSLLDSVRHHLVSDVPVGLFLSGGIDSTAVLALARQVSPQPLRTYSIAFAEAGWDEGDRARQIARHFEAEHTELQLTAAAAKALFPQYLAAIDQPSVDGFNSFCVSQLAHQQGAKVVLSGLGGDELFGGYGSFRRVPQMVRLGKRLRSLHPAAAIAGAGLEAWTRSPQLRRLGDFLQQPPTAPNAYRSFRGIFSHREARQIWRQFFPDRPLPARPESIARSAFPSLPDEVSWLELSGYMRNQLLRDSDSMSMAWGLELRVPFVDRALVETVSTIPAALRLQPQKRLLVEAVPELPDWVVNQPKRGFSFPFAEWFQDEWQECFAAIAPPPGVSIDLWYRRWSLAVLGHWYQKISGSALSPAEK